MSGGQNGCHTLENVARSIRDTGYLVVAVYFQVRYPGLEEIFSAVFLDGFPHVRDYVGKFVCADVGMSVDEYFGISPVFDEFFQDIAYVATFV